MPPLKRISTYCKANDDDDRHQLATHPLEKYNKKNNPPSSHLSLRHTISAVAFCGMYFYKRERKRGRENHAVRSHFDSHPHYDKSAVIKLRVSFSVFCFPTLSRVPQLERAGNKKEKRRMSSTDLEIPWKNYSMQERLHILQVLQRDVQLRRNEFERIRSVCSLLSNQKVVFSLM